jgi:hypothetical protein
VLGDLPSGVALTGSANAFTVGGHTITNASDVTTLILKGNVTQTANLFEVQNSAATQAFVVRPAGQVGVGAPLTGSVFYVNGTSGAAGNSAGIITARILAATNQTADILSLQNTSGTNLGGRNANAQIYSGSTSPITSTVGGATTAASGTGTTATITTTTATNLAVGDIVVVAGVTPTGYNTTGSVVTAVSNTSPFTVSYANATTGSQTVAGTVSTPAQASITARSAGTKGLVVKGTASQSGNLQEWQDSAGAILAYVSAAAVMRMSIVQGGAGAETDLRSQNSGGLFTMFRATAAATNPGANYARLYFRDGTTAGTLKLVVRAGTAGAETTILDNIPQ